MPLPIRATDTAQPISRAFRAVLMRCVEQAAPDDAAYMLGVMRERGLLDDATCDQEPSW